MPQTTPELRAMWPGGLEQAQYYLHGREFILSDRLGWTHPDNEAWGDLFELDRSAIIYLAEEWGYPGYRCARQEERGRGKC